MSFALIRKYGLITIGCLIYGLAFNWCYAPNDIAYGGFTGIAQMLHAVIPVLPVGATVFCLNVPLFFLGWKLLGGQLLVSSLYAMTLCSASVDLFASLFTFQPMDPLLACLYGGLLLGVGLGLVIGQSATTGGTDLLARLLKLPLPWLPMGKLMLALDLTVICATALVFGNLNTALYGLVALFLSTKVLDTVLYGMDTSKVAYIISDNPQQVIQAIAKDLDRGVTILHGTGAYSGQPKNVLMCAFKQRQIVTLKQAVKEVDPNAFLIVCDAHDVLGEGFRTYQKNDI